MNKVLTSVLSLAVAFSLGACSKKNDAPANAASVTFVNGCAGATGIDTKVNGANVSGAVNLAFATGSGYKTVTAGSANIAFYLTNVGTSVAAQTETLANGGHYSALCGGQITGPSFVFTTDDLSAPAANSAKIRLVNLSPDSISVSAAASATTIATGIGSYAASPFVSVTAGSYEVKAGDPAQIASFVSTGTQQFSAGKIYTVILTGSSKSTGPSALKLTMMGNN